MADDVAVVEAGGDTVMVHPGVGIANVSREADALVRRVEREGLGTPLWESEHETRLAIRGHGQSAPLAAMFFLHRMSSGERAAIESLSPVDPRRILAATFNFVLRDQARLLRQFDACWHIARSASLYTVECPPPVEAPALAEQILATVAALEPA